MENGNPEFNRIIPNFNKIARALAYSSIYLSFAGGAMVFLSCSLQSIAFSPVAALIMIFVTYAVYNLNRKTDEVEDSVNHFERYSFTKRYGGFLYRTAALAYVGAAVFGLFYGIEAFFVTMIPILSGILYSIPFLPKGARYSRIKEVPVLKSATVALAWAIPPAFLPVYLLGTGVTLQTWLIALFFFTLVFVNTVMFDIRDIIGDRDSGVTTIPVILGAEKTVLFLSALNLGAGVLIIILGQALFSLQQVLFLCFAIIYAQTYILLFKEKTGDKITSEIFMDGQFIILMLVYFSFLTI